MTSLIFYELLVGAVVLERVVELIVSTLHARTLVARGAVEHGRGHYPAMVALHTAFLLGCIFEPLVFSRPFVPLLAGPMVALAIAAQGVRWWAIRSLGVRWSTRVFVLPGHDRVSGGPYRFLPHPNYVAVVVEGMALPLVHSAWLTALVFTLLDAWLIHVRIRTEDAALDAAAPA